MAQTIFYVWQSWDSANTRGVVRNAIEFALDKLGGSDTSIEDVLRPEVDEDSRSTGGTADEIHTRILDRIELADVVVVDITNISNRKRDRLSPNPNVMFELSWALSKNGWNRVILVANEDFGKGQMPFDIRNKFTHYFSIERAESRRKAARSLGSRLVAPIVSALQTAERRTNGLSIEVQSNSSEIEISMGPDLIPLGLKLVNGRSPTIGPVGVTIVYWSKAQVTKRPDSPILDLCETTKPNRRNYALHFNAMRLPMEINGMSEVELPFSFPRPGGKWRAGLALIVTGLEDPYVYQVEISVRDIVKRWVDRGGDDRHVELLRYDITARPTRDRPRVFIE